MTDTEAKAIIEAALLASDKPLALEFLRAALEEYTPAQLAGLVAQLQQDYVAQGRGMRLVEVAGGWQLVTDPAWADRLGKIYRKTRAARLSRPALETLAIIAYRQPITRAEIEEIRGVNVDGVIQSLLDRGVIQIVGRKEAVGRPLMYGTTPAFLERFGLKSLEGLPTLAELPQPEGSRSADRPSETPPAAASVAQEMPGAQPEVASTTD